MSCNPFTERINKKLCSCEREEVLEYARKHLGMKLFSENFFLAQRPRNLIAETQKGLDELSVMMGVPKELLLDSTKITRSQMGAKRYE